MECFCFVGRYDKGPVSQAKKMINRRINKYRSYKSRGEVKIDFSTIYQPCRTSRIVDLYHNICSCRNANTKTWRVNLWLSTGYPSAYKHGIITSYTTKAGISRFWSGSIQLSTHTRSIRIY